MSEEEPSELGEPDKLIIGGALGAGKKHIESLIIKAYERGRAEMRKELLGDGKFDGWCARHPERGFNFVSLNSASSDTARMMHVDEEYGGESYGYEDEDQSWLKAQEEGWQIKPVKLIEVEEPEK